MNSIPVIKPTAATIITTYKCTAACYECCFACNPRETQRLTLEEITNFIEEANNLYNLDLCVFTGGECTLLGEDLFRAISFAHGLGLRTRIVSNGHWGSRMNIADAFVERLIHAGLDEINLSTGDEHQKWVPLKAIENIIISSYQHGLPVFVNVEFKENSDFRKEELMRVEAIKNILDADKGKTITIFNGIWVPFREGSVIKQPDTVVKKIPELNQTHGCDSILTFVGITPSTEIAACCGLTMEYIGSMKLGSYTKGNLKETFQKQFADFLKIWLFVDGPEKILYFAYQKDPSVEQLISNISHPCEACALIYNNEKIRNVIFGNYKEVEDSVLFKYILATGQRQNSEGMMKNA